MEDMIVSIGAVVFIVFQIALLIVKQKNSGELIAILNNHGERLNQIIDTTTNTKDMHNHFTDEGLPVWYIPKSFSIEHQKILETQEKMLDLIKDITVTQKEILKFICCKMN